MPTRNYGTCDGSAVTRRAGGPGAGGGGGTGLGVFTALLRADLNSVFGGGCDFPVFSRLQEACGGGGRGRRSWPPGRTAPLCSGQAAPSRG